MMTLGRPTVDPWFEDWKRVHQQGFRDLLADDPFATGFVKLATSTKWIPAPLCLPPTGGMHTGFAEELAQVRRFDDDTVAAELVTASRHSWQPQDLGWATGRSFADRIADLMQAIWARDVEPYWSQRRTVLQRDVMYRAGLLAAYGWPAAIEKMSRHSAWVAADAIQFSSHEVPDKHVAATGLQFVPVTRCSGTWLAENAAGEYAVVYPARGRADQPARVGSDAVDRLLGTGRARVLRALDRPATTSELAADVAAALGTVGDHLAVLRNAGLVIGTRIGHRVVYRRTDLGEQLLGHGSGVRQDTRPEPKRRQPRNPNPLI
jgi:DNA-binding transcriptional ArsR family regulator